ncbi:MAG TPA: hypothetical protein VG992_03445 [Candidatus Saccharimonadales bacterium]|nr:hypothetical protein [Candidatus Saccharimonadales bacterium]
MAEFAPNLHEQATLSTVEQLVEAQPEIVGLQSYEYFRSEDIAPQKAAFLAGAIPHMQPNYPELSDTNLDRVGYPMKQALETTMSGHESLKVSALFDAIEYRASELFLLKAAKEMNDTSKTETERAESRDWFKLASEGLYGKPEQDVFNAIAHAKLLPLIEQAQITGINKEIADELSALLGPIGESNYEIVQPDTETMARVGALVRERFDPLMAHIDPEKIYANEEVRDALNVVLQQLGGHELGWQVVLTENASVVSVSAHKKQIEVGMKRKEKSGKDLYQVVVHELGVHTLRSINAEKAGYLSAAYGQDGYLDFEEALGMAFETAYSGGEDAHSDEYYLLAGLVYGLDGHEPRDLKAAHEIHWRFKSLLMAKGRPLESVDDSLGKSQRNAMLQEMRLFRGTDTQQSGLIYTKDLAMFNGKQSVWECLRNVHTQADLDLLLAGKLDLSRSDHRTIADHILAA